MNLINISFFIKSSLENKLIVFIKDTLADAICSFNSMAQFNLYQVMSPQPAEADEVTYSLQIRFKTGDNETTSFENFLTEKLNRFRISVEQEMLFFISRMEEYKL